VEQVEIALTGSAEYFRVRAGGNRVGILEALYGTVLRRSVDRRDPGY
jgi:hypothetical protein